MSSYKSFFNPTNMLVVAALLALILFRHSLFPEATESTEVKQLMGKVDAVVDDMQKSEKEEKSVVAPSGHESLPMRTNEMSPYETVKNETIEKPQTIAGNKDDEADALAVWQSARRAAWDGNSDASVENYRALIALQPENYDAYGEMGNVLLQMGDTDAAVDAYAQAALLLGKAGYPQAAWHVMNIVAKLDQNRAQQLHESLYGKPLPSEQ